MWFRTGGYWTVLSMMLFGIAYTCISYVYSRGYSAAERDAAAERLASVARAIEQAQAQAAIDAAILRDAVQIERAVITRTQTRTREVIRYVDTVADYRLCRLDDCGLCHARAAARDADPTACACDADAALPGAAGAGGDDGRAVDRLRGNGGAVSPVRGAGGGLDRMDGGREG